MRNKKFNLAILLAVMFLYVVVFSQIAMASGHPLVGRWEPPRAYARENYGRGIVPLFVLRFYDTWTFSADGTGQWDEFGAREFQNRFGRGSARDISWSASSTNTGTVTVRYAGDSFRPPNRFGSSGTITMRYEIRGRSLFLTQTFSRDHGPSTWELVRVR